MNSDIASRLYRELPTLMSRSYADLHVYWPAHMDDMDTFDD
jgi:hypothetical protein